MKDQKYIKFKRPRDNGSYKLFTYIVEGDNGDEPIWFNLVPHANSCVTSLMANIERRPELNMVKTGHRFTLFQCTVTNNAVRGSRNAHTQNQKRH